VNSLLAMACCKDAVGEAFNLATGVRLRFVILQSGF
jgi:hypothetical protein